MAIPSEEFDWFTFCDKLLLAVIKYNVKERYRCIISYPSHVEYLINKPVKNELLALIENDEMSSHEKLNTILTSDEHQYRCLASKGIDRLAAVRSVLREGHIRDKDGLYHISGWSDMNPKQKILIAASMIVTFQAFSDANHRSADAMIKMVFGQIKNIHEINSSIDFIHRSGKGYYFNDSKRCALAVGKYKDYLSDIFYKIDEFTLKFLP